MSLIIFLLLGGVGAYFFSNEKAATQRRFAALESIIASLQRQIHTLEIKLTGKEPDAPEIKAEALSVTVEPPVVAASIPHALKSSDEIEPRSPPQESQDKTSREPSSVDHFFAAHRDFFTGGNLIVRLGIVILFFGVAFLVKFATDKGLLPIEIRLAGVDLMAAFLIGLGWRLRLKRAGYAVALQGGGVAIFYLTVFASFRLYGLIPAALTFPTLVVVMVLSSILAVGQNAMSLVVLGVSGGFLAPILTSTGQGNHFALFSYYAVLNAGIVGMAWIKAWRPLNLLGFIFTFGIGTLWGVEKYQPENFASTEFFLILFSVSYVVISILFASRQKPNLKGIVDGPIVFATPLVFATLQYGLVERFAFGMAYSTLAAAIFYLAVARVLFARSENFRALVECFLAIGVAFGTAAIALAFDARGTAALWALEGTGLVWIGLKQNRLLARGAGFLLILSACLSVFDWILWTEWRYARGLDDWFLLNAFWFGALIKTVSALTASTLLEKRRGELKFLEKIYGPILTVVGFSWWYVAGLWEIESFATSLQLAPGWILLFVASAAIFETLRRKLSAKPLRHAASWLVPAGWILFLTLPGRLDPYLGWSGILVWSAFAGVHYFVRRARDAETLPWTGRLMHGAAVWLLTAVLCHEISWAVSRLEIVSATWSDSVFLFVPAMLIFVLLTLRETFPWPFGRHRRTYLTWGIFPVAVFSALYLVVFQFANSGDPAPLPYLPFLNPLELASMAGIFALIFYYRAASSLCDKIFRPSSGLFFRRMIGVLVFIFLNGALIRLMHHLAGIPFDYDAMVFSNSVQTALSIFWALFAMALMVFATRKSARSLWMTGAALLGVVVIKLFLVDLSNTGTVFRIVSFIGVGGLLLTVGYFSPLPPRRSSNENA